MAENTPRDHFHLAFKNISIENDSIYNQMYLPHYPGSLNSVPTHQQVWYLIDQYAVPIIFTVGIIFNMLTAVVVLKTELKKCSPCLYIVALSVVDNVFLIQKMIPWASMRVYDIYNVAGICQLTYYCNYLSTFLEWWFIVMLLTERVVLQYCGRHARKMCSPFRTKCSLITVAIFAIVFHLYLTWTSAVITIFNRSVCIIIPENAEDIVQLRKVDIIFAFILPSFLLIILVMCCLHKLLNSRKVNSPRNPTRTLSRGNYNSSVKRQSAPTIVINAKRTYLKGFESKIFSDKLRVTLVTITMALCLLLLCVPYDSLRTKMTMINDATREEGQWLQLLHEIYAVNFAYKGLLYLFTFAEFRLASWRLLKLSIQSLFSKSNSFDIETSDV